MEGGGTGIDLMETMVQKRKTVTMTLRGVF